MTPSRYKIIRSLLFFGRDGRNRGYLLLWTLSQNDSQRVMLWIESTADDLARAGWKEIIESAAMVGRARRAWSFQEQARSAITNITNRVLFREKIFARRMRLMSDIFSNQARLLIKSCTGIARPDCGCRGRDFVY